MSKTYIPKALRTKIRQEGRGFCSYCQTSEQVTGSLMEVDHIIPEALGGLTQEINLCLACRGCNDYKKTKIEAFDPLTKEVVALFHPKRQNWNEHFEWSTNGEQILGRTPVGRATIETVKLNRVELVRSRRMWVSAGWHPPKD